MNSRDRLRNGKFAKEIEDRIKEMLKEHPGLKKLQNERRAAAVQERLSDDKPLQDVLQNILNKSPVLSKILLTGTRLSSPFNSSPSVGEASSFSGKKHPTFFDLKGQKKDGIFKRKAPINHGFRVQFETDVVNDYFVRPDEKGSLKLKLNGDLRSDLVKSLSLFNGTATLTIRIPDKARVGDVLVFQASIEDDCITQTFENEFQVEIESPKEYSGGIAGARTPPKDGNSNGTRQSPSQAALPQIEEVYKDAWNQFNMDKNSALDIRTIDEGSDYFLNMDNQYLLMELKGVRDQNRIQLTKARYKYSMTLIGMSIESYYKSKPENIEDSDDTPDIPTEIRKISSMIAPILVPMLESMAELEIEES